MKMIDEVITELSRTFNRHEKFKKLFKEFQENITHIANDPFPVKGISVNNDDEHTKITFLGRKYEIRFSSANNGEIFKGIITIFKYDVEGNTTKLSAVEYNGNGIADIDPPTGEDPISLTEDSCCINLVLNWLHEDICITNKVRL